MYPIRQEREKNYFTAGRSMNPISSDLTSFSVWPQNVGQNKETALGTTPSGSATDTVALSPEALALSTNGETAAAVSVTAAEQSAQVSDNTKWGPDLIEGWNDPGYLRMVDGGFVGSLSMTTAKGTKVGIAAEVNEDGSPAQTVMITVQDADGSMQQYRLDKRASTSTQLSSNQHLIDSWGGSIRITETDEGVEVSEAFVYHDITDDGIITRKSKQSTDSDDIIVVMGGHGYGGGGNDTMISLGGCLDGGDGDDTLVAIAPVEYKTDGSVDTRLDGGNGNDTFYIREHKSNGTALYTGAYPTLPDHCGCGRYAVFCRPPLLALSAAFRYSYEYPQQPS